MTKTLAFWDSSALVPLCIHEATSHQAESHLRKSIPVVWWGSQVEVYSALARLERTGLLEDREKQGALSRLTLLSSSWKEILPGDQLRELATQLLDTHDLRAADSLQLAAALTWCQLRPAKRRFVCADARLSKAAAATGFDVTELSRH